MKKLLILFLAAIMLLSLAACGGNDAPSSQGNEDNSPVEPSDDAANTPDEAEEADPSDAISATEIAIGDTITLDFVEMTFEETGIAADIRQSITTGIVTRTTGPDPAEGKQYLYIRGTIKNLAKSELPV